MSEKKEVAVIGDINTAIGFRLAGLKRVYAMEDNVEDMKLNKLLKELCSNSQVGIILLTDNIANRVKKARIENMNFQIVVSIPKLQKPEFPDAKNYYKEQITNVLGFSIEL